jgi:hypothetical protein
MYFFLFNAQISCTYKKIKRKDLIKRGILNQVLSNIGKVGSIILLLDCENFLSEDEIESISQYL